jgi:hypothetical protein
VSMFWPKRKNLLESDSDLHKLAGRLGIERRQNIRIRVPTVQLRKLPKIEINNYDFKMADLSVGGCCLLDPAEVLGSRAGNVVTFDFKWNGESTRLKARIVAQVFRRIHVQFMDLSERLAEEIKMHTASGARGLWLNSHSRSVDKGPSLMASEMWSSPYGDSVVIFEDKHRIAEVFLYGITYTLFRQTWPMKSPDIALSRLEVADLLLFLCNIPNPSDWICALVTSLEILLQTEAAE